MRDSHLLVRGIQQRTSGGGVPICNWLNICGLVPWGFCPTSSSSWSATTVSGSA